MNFYQRVWRRPAASVELGHGRVRAGAAGPHGGSSRLGSARPVAHERLLGPVHPSVNDGDRGGVGVQEVPDGPYGQDQVPCDLAVQGHQKILQRDCANMHLQVAPSIIGNNGK